MSTYSSKYLWARKFSVENILQVVTKSASGHPNHNSQRLVATAKPRHNNSCLDLRQPYICSYCKFPTNFSKFQRLYTSEMFLAPEIQNVKVVIHIWLENSLCKICTMSFFHDPLPGSAGASHLG